MFHVKHLFKKPRRGLACGGGGVRALSGLGVLRHFEKNSISFDYISGTSMGAVVGALYSYHQSATDVEEKLRQIYEGEIFSHLREEFDHNLKSMDITGEEGIKERLTAYYSRLKFLKNIYTETSLISGKKIRNFIEELIPDVVIGDLPLEFCCVATDLVEGRRKVFREGPLREAIMASIAVPGIIPPLELEDSVLTDGGSASMTPVEELKEMGADLTVAVEVFPHLPRRLRFDRGLEILERCSRITSRELHERQLEVADVVISPEVKNIVWSDFRQFDYVIAAGETAAFGTEKHIK